MYLQNHEALTAGILSILLILSLLAPTVMMSPALEGAPHAQPLLLEIAGERPEGTVAVIFQKLGQDASAEELVGR